jgi:hypothetical protein
VVSAASSRRLLACLVGAGVLALLVTARAEAGYGVAPGNGQTFTVSSDSVGSITDPSTLDFVVYLDAEDSDPYVWISESPQMHGGGTPAGGSVASCAAFELIPFGEQNKWVCRASTILMKPGRTYYWWLDFRRRDPGANVTTDRISGPFSFTLTAVQPPPSEEDPHEGVSSKTVESAATLPGATVFNGARSIKHTKLTQLVYRTMKEFGLPRSLAFACWSPTDWLAVLAAEGAEPTNGSSVLLGFWLRRQPRWLHLAPRSARSPLRPQPRHEPAARALPGNARPQLRPRPVAERILERRALPRERRVGPLPGLPQLRLTRRRVLVRLVAAVEQDRVAVRIVQPGSVADARVPHLVHLDARRHELRPRLGDIGDAEGERPRRERRELVVVGVRRHHRERDVAGLVLDPVLVRRVRVPRQAEHAP